MNAEIVEVGLSSLLDSPCFAAGPMIFSDDHPQFLLHVQNR